MRNLCVTCVLIVSLTLPRAIRAADWVDSTLATLSLEEKVGQLFAGDIVAVYAHEKSPAMQYAHRLIDRYHVGTVVLAGGTIRDIAAVTNALQARSRVPLLVNADLESGLGFAHGWTYIRGRAPELPHTVSGGGTIITSMMGIGATGDPHWAYEAGRITAEEARAIGIHWTNAPVADVNNNPDNPIINTRSFGEDPVAVAKYVAACVRGFQQNGLIATVKHFPGHGDTRDDTHMKLPLLAFDKKRLMSVEMVPFRAGIEADVKAVMTAHIALTSLDPELRPSTLSPPVITGLLRHDLGFRGVVITDGMTMQGVTDLYPPGDAAVRSIEAGADVILVPENFDMAYHGVVSAVLSGRISGDRLDASVRRVLALKAGLGLQRARTVDVDRIDHIVGAPEHDSLASTITNASITVLRNAGNILPLRRSRIGLITIAPDGSAPVGDELVSVLSQAGCDVALARCDNEPCTAQMREAEEVSASADAVICAVYLSIGSWKGALQLDSALAGMIDRLARRTSPLIVVAMGDPYVLRILPESDAVIAAYAGTPRVEASVGRALLGTIQTTGRLPVTIPGRYVRGAGLTVQRVGEHSGRGG